MLKNTSFVRLTMLSVITLRAQKNFFPHDSEKNIDQFSKRHDMMLKTYKKMRTHLNVYLLSMYTFEFV